MWEQTFDIESSFIFQTVKAFYEIFLHTFGIQIDNKVIFDSIDLETHFNTYFDSWETSELDVRIAN